MIGSSRGKVLAAILAALLVAALPGSAFASPPWLADCDGGGGSNYVCIYSDRNFLGNIAHMSGSNSSYVGETYPSSSINVNDSASSVKNLYSSKDVSWFNDPSSGGPEFCVNSNTAVVWVGLFNNDAFSRHAVFSNASVC
jgi:hypothetical protein